MSVHPPFGVRFKKKGFIRGRSSAELVQFLLVQSLCVPCFLHYLSRAGSVTHLFQLLHVQFSTIVQSCSEYHV